MVIYFFNFIVRIYYFLKAVGLTYLFSRFFYNFFFLLFFPIRYFFRFYNLLHFFFFFERVIDFFLWFYYTILHDSNVINGLFVVKFFFSRLFFLISRFFFSYSFYLFWIFNDLSKYFQKKNSYKSVEVDTLFYFFFFRKYLRHPYRSKTEWYDNIIYDHSRVLQGVFFVMFITSIFFFNARMVSIFPYGICCPHDFNWFKFQPLEGVNKYVYHFWKDVWRNRFWKGLKSTLWEIFVYILLDYILPPFVYIERLLFKG